MKQNDPMYIIDELAEQAGGYFAMPSQYDMAYTDLLFDICQQFGIGIILLRLKKKAFVEEVTRVTWAKRTGIFDGYQSKIFVLPFPHNHLSHNKKMGSVASTLTEPIFLGA